MQYWLMKTEPDVLSIEKLKLLPNATTSWDGVRNYQARNYMRDDMKINDLVLIYHSSCKEIGISGLAKVTRQAYPDHTQFDKESPYFDIKATKSNPRWFMVDIKWIKTFKRIIPLQELKDSSELKNMPLVKKGSRLSIQPVQEAEFNYILTLE